jgi:hypothetical protein
MRKSRKNIKKHKKISKRFKNRQINGGEYTKIHILYVLGTKNSKNQIQLIAMSKSIKNLHLNAIDLSSNTEIRDDNKEIYKEFGQILDNNMYIDTIELDNPKTLHNWQKVNLEDINTLISNGTYGITDKGIPIQDDIDEIPIYYSYDRTSTITGVIDSVYKDALNREFDGEIMLDEQRIGTSLESLGLYEPIDYDLVLIDNNLSIESVPERHSRILNKYASEQNKIYILYVLGTMEGDNQLQLCSMSKSLKNIQLFARDLRDIILYDDESKSKKIFENNMVIDTIQLNNAYKSHSWQKVSTEDINKLTRKADNIDEIPLYYTFDQSINMTGIIGTVYTDKSDYIYDDVIKSELGNFDQAVKVLNNYYPLDIELVVVDNKLSIMKVKERDYLLKPNKLHILYVLSTKKSNNQIQLVAMSKSLSNIQLFAMDLLNNLRFDNKIESQKIFENNIVIDTIQLDTKYTSHSWQKLSLEDINKRIRKADNIDEIPLYYNFNKSSTITGVIDAVYTDEPRKFDNNILSEFGNFNEALKVLNDNEHYVPLDMELIVVDNKLSIRVVNELEPRSYLSISPCPISLNDLRYKQSQWSEINKNGCRVIDLLNQGKIPLEYILNKNNERDKLDTTMLQGLELRQLISKDGFPLKQLANHYTLDELKKETFGFDDQQELNDNFNIVFDVYTMDQLYKSGYTFKFLYDRGATPAQLATINIGLFNYLNELDKIKIIELDKLDKTDVITPKLIKENFNFNDIINTSQKLIFPKLFIEIIKLYGYRSALKLIKDNGNIHPKKLISDYNYRIKDLLEEYSVIELWNNGIRDIDQLKEIIKINPDAIILLKENTSIAPKILISDYNYKIEDLLNLYSVVELWAHGIRDIDALISARAKLDELIKLKDLDIKEYIQICMKSDFKIKLEELKSKFSIIDIFNTIPNENISYISLIDLINSYRDNIPELLKVTTPEYLFATGLFTYGDLKHWIKNDKTGDHNKKFKKLSKECKKNLFRRQTNLDCKYIPENFPNPLDNKWSKNIKGKAINETIRYPA